MNKWIQLLKQRGADLLLTAIVLSWPVARFLKGNAFKIYASFDLVVFYVLFFCFALFFIKKSKTLLAFLTLFLCFFAFKDLTSALENHFSLLCDFFHAMGGRLAYLWFFFLVVVITLGWFSKFFSAFIRAFLAVVPLVAWIEVLPSLVTTPTYQIQENHEFDAITLKHKPNIYFLMIDGYPSEKTCEEILRQPNSLSCILREKGFYVPRETISNYHFTLASLSSQFQMCYHETKQGGLQYNEFAYPVVGKNNLIRILKRNGYSFVFAPSGALSEISCRGFEDVCLAPSRNMDVFQVFQKMTPLIYLPPLFQGRYLEPDDIQSFIKKRKANKPFFLFAHFLQVHDVVDTRAGRAQDDPQTCVIYDQKSMDKYQSVREAFDKKISKLVSDVMQKDPRAIIVINSDHGPPIKLDPNMTPEERIKYWSEWESPISDKDLGVRLSNMIALYIPQFKVSPALYLRYFREQMSNVNIFRGVLSFLTEKNIPYLADKAFLVVFNKNRNCYDVLRQHQQNS